MGGCAIRKIMTYENELGQKMTFCDHAPLYLERLNACSIDADITSEKLLGAVGQRTYDVSLPGQPIEASLAVTEPDSHRRQILLDRVLSLFEPTLSGKMYIRNADGLFFNECRVLSRPFPEKQTVRYMYKFDIRFMADYPYFRRCGEKSVQSAIGDSSSFSSASPVKTPFKAVFVAGGSGTFRLNGKAFHFTTALPVDVYFSSSDYSFVDANGNDVSYLVSSLTDFNQAYIRYGNNTIENTFGNVILTYSQYVPGVI